MLKSHNGFTLVELLIVVTVVGIIAAIAIPGMLRARMSANEASAIGSLRAINNGQTAFFSSCGIGGYATSLSQLFAPAKSGGQGFISPDLALDTSIKSGYTVLLTDGSSTRIVTGKAETCSDISDALATYFGEADPVAFGRTGTRHFGTDERGTIFQNTADDALTIATLTTSGTIGPIGPIR